MIEKELERLFNNYCFSFKIYEHNHLYLRQLYQSTLKKYDDLTARLEMIGDTKFVYLKGKRADFITCLKTSVFSFQPFDMDKFYVKS